MIFTTLVDEDELWIGGFDGPVKHYKNDILVKNYVTGNARKIVKGPRDKIYVGSPNGFFEINKTTFTTFFCFFLKLYQTFFHQTPYPTSLDVFY